MLNTLAKYNPLRYRGYVYDRETGLYYLQSRYYNPEWGRFINADAYISTGQGFTGHNMFAYCLNNPVNHADEGGVYADSYAGWCGTQIAIWFYELFTGNDHPHHQTEALEREVIETQTEIIIDTTAEVGKSLWEAHEQNVKLEAERQYQQDMRVREYFGFFRENPLVGIDLATGIIRIETTYVGICATAGLVSIPVAGQVGLGIIGLACGLWGLGRLIAAIPSN